MAAQANTNGSAKIPKFGFQKSAEQLLLFFLCPQPFFGERRPENQKLPHLSLLLILTLLVNHCQKICLEIKKKAFTFHQADCGHP
jgi:hypothetical protein